MFDLFAGYVCDSVPFVFVSRETDANIIWFEFTILIFSFYANFLFFNCVIHYFRLQVHAARLILSLFFFFWLPSFDLCRHYSPLFVVTGLCFPHHITSLLSTLLFFLRNLLLIQFVLGILMDSLMVYALFINGSKF